MFTSKEIEDLAKTNSSLYLACPNFRSTLRFGQLLPLVEQRYLFDRPVQPNCPPPTQLSQGDTFCILSWRGVLRVSGILFTCPGESIYCPYVMAILGCSPVILLVWNQDMQWQMEREREMILLHALSLPNSASTPALPQL